MIVEWFIRYGGIGAVLASFLFCTGTPIITTGGSSDTEVSARISGIAIDAAGMPVAGATVQLRQTDYLPGAAITAETIGTSIRLNSVTNELGAFLFDAVDDGDYLIEVKADDSAGAIVECRMTNAVSCTVAPVVKPVGMVIGQIDYTYYNTSSFNKTKIEVLGTEHVVYPDSNLWFQIPIAEGTHRMKISVDSSSFDSMMVNVEVRAAQQRNMGTVLLNFQPMPPCWDFSCDSTVLRGLLDSAGHPEVPVQQVVTGVFNDRVVSLDLRGISLGVSLASLGRLSGLEELDLGNTGTADSCRFLPGLRNLRVLRLNDNNLVWFSRTAEKMPRLEILDLSNNKLSVLPERLVESKTLKIVAVTGNRLCMVSPMMAFWLDYYDADWRSQQVCY